MGVVMVVIDDRDDIVLDFILLPLVLSEGYEAPIVDLYGLVIDPSYMIRDRVADGLSPRALWRSCSRCCHCQ